MVSRVLIAGTVVLLIAAIALGLYLTSSPQTSVPTTGSASQGKMAVLATDPPTGPSSARQYAHYSNAAAHKSGGSQSNSSTGWVLLNATGTLDLNSLVNASQTIAVANLGAGAYDSIRLYVDSATVTYNGQNYTASVQNSQVTASLANNVQVGGSATAAVIFDLRTLVVNTGTSTSPQFVFVSSARADTISSSDSASLSLQVGARTDLSAAAWFKTFESASAHLQVTSATITSNSLSVGVKNTGSENANVKLVIVTPVSTLGGIQVVVPGTLQGSAVFVASAGGSLHSVSALTAGALFGSTGIDVTSSTTATLSYSGTIQFGSLVIGGVQTGQSYLITILGDNAATSTVVVAG